MALSGHGAALPGREAVVVSKLGFLGVQCGNIPFLPLLQVPRMKEGLCFGGTGSRIRNDQAPDDADRALLRVDSLQQVDLKPDL